jgi:hypothetical protein
MNVVYRGNFQSGVYLLILDQKSHPNIFQYAGIIEILLALYIFNRKCIISISMKNSFSVKPTTENMQMAKAGLIKYHEC